MYVFLNALKLSVSVPGPKENVSPRVSELVEWGCCKAGCVKPLIYRFGEQVFHCTRDWVLSNVLVFATGDVNEGEKGLPLRALYMPLISHPPTNFEATP